MGVKQTYRLITEDGKEIRTTINHPYLVKNASGKELKHSSPINNAGWVVVAELRAGDEIAVAEDSNRNNLMDSRLYRSNGILAEGTDLFSHQSFINGENVSKSNRGRQEQTTNLLLSLIQDVFKLGSFYFGADHNDDDVIARAIPVMRRNDERRSLFGGSEVAKWEGKDDNIPGITLDHRQHLQDYPRSQESFARGSSTRAFPYSLHQNLFGNLFDNVLKGATKAAASLRASMNLSLSRLGLRLDFAYASNLNDNALVRNANSVAHINLDTQLNENNKSEKAIFWAKISSIEVVAEEQVYDLEIEGTHNFVANGIIAHNTYLTGGLGVGLLNTTSGTLQTSGVATIGGLATFTNGFLSNASSTITSGLFSMNGGASTTNATASGTLYSATAS
ncbi:MAG: hypothetical protein AAB947_01680, partial [Patescibacteria group bacterium]